MTQDSMFKTYIPVYTVEIEGETLPEDAILSITVDEELESAARFELTLNDRLDRSTQEFTWLGNPLLDPGKTVKIFLDYVVKRQQEEQQKQLLIVAKIKALSPNFSGSGAPGLTVEGYDLSHAMHKHITDVKDEQVKYSDIAKELAQEYGLTTEGVTDSSHTHQKVERQAGQKDYAFLRSLAETIGYEFFVRNTAMYFRPPQDSGSGEVLKTFRYGENIISFSPRLSISSVLTEVKVCGWDPQAKEEIEETATLGQIQANPELTRLVEAFLENAGEIEPETIEDEAIQSSAEARLRAEVELNKAVNTFIEGNLECVGDPELRIGNRIDIQRVGKLFTGTYYITTARHSFGGNGYTTNLGVRRTLR